MIVCHCKQIIHLYPKSLIIIGIFKHKLMLMSMLNKTNLNHTKIKQKTNVLTEFVLYRFISKIDKLLKHIIELFPKTWFLCIVNIMVKINIPNMTSHLEHIGRIRYIRKQLCNSDHSDGHIIHISKDYRYAYWYLLILV